MDESDLTYGGKAVGVDFNPSGDPGVQRMKEHYANVIDQLDEQREAVGRGEKSRLLSIAITEAQGAQMWAVKALTWKD